jgi:hypothetical protein
VALATPEDGMTALTQWLVDPRHPGRSVARIVSALFALAPLAAIALLLIG